MADNINVKDASGIARTLKTVDVAGVHTPVHKVEGALTDAELRASAVPVSGPVTNTELRASPVVVSGPLTNGELRAAPLDVEGPLTDAELRAAPLDVEGPLTNAELRGVPVAVSDAANPPISCGIFAVAATVNINIDVPAGAKEVILYPKTQPVLYRFDIAPGAPVADTLGMGGIARSASERVVRIPSGALKLYILSTSATDATDVNVEFTGN